VPDALKTEAVCLAAVLKDHIALQFVPDAQKTEAICLAAVLKDRGALAYVPEAIRTEAFMAKISLLSSAISSGSGGSGYGIELIKP
jgi:hypothetical protein